MWFNMYGTDLRTSWCRTVKIGQGVSTGWAKNFEKISLSHVFGPIGHVVLQGGPKMNDAKPVFLISPIVLQPATSLLQPVSSQRREVAVEYVGQRSAHILT